MINTLELENGLKKDNIIKNIKNLFGLKKKQITTQLKLQEKQRKKNQSCKKSFQTIKENETIKVKIIRDIETIFEEKDDYYKPISVCNFWNNNYIEYESN